MPVFAGGFFDTQNDSLKQEKQSQLKRTISSLTSGKVTIIQEERFAFYAAQRATEKPFYPIFSFEAGPYQVCLIGHLFRKDLVFTPSVVTALREEELHLIFNTNGVLLSKNYWGQYVLIISDKTQKRLALFPDPLGLFSLFYTQTSEGFFFSSDLAPLVQLRSNKKSLHPLYLQGTLIATLGGMLASHHTPFQDIFELRPGEGLTKKGQQTERVIFWNPLDYINPKDFSEDRIISTFLSCVSAWDQVSPAIGLHLSGGLDSTALLFAAHHITSSEKTLIGLNYRLSTVKSSDEWRHATRAAQSANIKLLEYTWSHHYDFSLIEESPASAWDRPHIGYLTRKTDQALEALIKDYDNIVFWSGHGGDQLFYEGFPPYAGVDYICQKGVRGLWENVMTLCTLYREPVPLFLKNNLLEYWRYLGNGTPKADVGFKKPAWFKGSFEEKELYPLFEMPFFPHHPSTLPGKRKHISEIYEGTFNSGVYEKLNSVPTLYPYYSQPLVELALAMPVYASYSQHMSRFPFRQALSQFFKTDLVWRRSKGDTSGVIQVSFEKNQHTIRELVLEGFSSCQGYIDRALLEQALSLVLAGNIENIRPLLNLIALESWFKHWQFS